MIFQETTGTLRQFKHLTVHKIALLEHFTLVEVASTSTEIKGKAKGIKWNTHR